MGLKNFQIVFDDPLATVVSGHKISGRVLLSLDSPKNIRGIFIKFKGEGGVHWTRREHVRDSSGRSTSRTVRYRSTEIYFENKFAVAGGDGGNMTLEVGEYCYLFSMQLPANIPSSFEHRFGHCRYTVKANMDRPWKFDHDVKAAFTVISALDLNMDPTVRVPVKCTEEKFFCCCCCKSGPLTLVASLPVTGYVPGQEIPLTVEVDNISQEIVSDVTITLRQNLTFHASLPKRDTRWDTLKICAVSLGSVGKNGSKVWTHMFKIPALPPSNLLYCNCIDLNYELKIEANVLACCHAGMNLKVPLVIGTIPLMGYQQPMAGPPGDGQADSYRPTAPPAESPEKGSDSPPTYATGPQHPVYNSMYPDLPPPSYNEAMFGAQNIQDDDDNEHVQGNMEFTPRYPVYNFLPSAPSL